MAANGTADSMISPRHGHLDVPENEADSQKKKSAFQITSVKVKDFSEDDNQQHPRSMDELDLETDRNDSSTYAVEPGYESFDNGVAGGGPHEFSAPLHHPGSGSARTFSHAADPKGSRFVVVKVESKEPYIRGRWKCMDFFDESDKGDMSIVKGADSSGSSRASSMNYVHGVDDPLRNPLLHNIPETVKQQTEPAISQQGVLSSDGPSHHGPADLALKAAVAGYPAGAAMPAGPGLPPVQTQTAHAQSMASLSHSSLATAQPKAAGSGAALFGHPVPNARTPVEVLAGGAAGVGPQSLHDIYAATVPLVDTEIVGQDSRPSANLPPVQQLSSQQQQQLVQQPKNAIIIVKPEPMRSTQVPAALAMTLVETLGGQAREEPSATDPQLRDSDALTTSVAIDNKIEQAMDLVKSHLMFAVREEVEELRQQIKELMDDKSRLEYENSVLRGALSPEMLAKLLPPTAQPAGSGLKAVPLPQNS